MSTIILCIPFLFISLFFGDLAVGQPASVSEADAAGDVLTIAMARDLVPLTFINSAGDPAGILVDIWRLWAEKNNRRVTFLASDWSESLENVETGKADIHSGLRFSERRTRRFDFGWPIYEVKTSIYLRKGATPNRLSEMKGKKIGVIVRTKAAGFLKTHIPDVRVVAFESLHEMIRALKEGDVFAVAVNRTTMDHTILMLGMADDFDKSPEILYTSKLAPCVKKGNKPLLDLVNSGFDKITDQELLEIENRWIHNPDRRYFSGLENSFQPTVAERKWLRDHPTVRLALYSGFEPLLFIDENGKFHGILKDLTDLIGKRVGLEFEIVPFDPTIIDDITLKARNKEFDMVIARKTPERRAFMNFTAPILPANMVIVTRDKIPFLTGLGDLPGNNVVVTSDAVLGMIKDDFPDIHFTLTNNSLQALESVSSGRMDAYVGELISVGYLIRKHGLNNLKIAAPAGYSDVGYRIAVRNDWPELAGILNKAIATIDRHERDAIMGKWVPIRFEYGIDWAWVRNVMLVIVGGFTILIIVSLFWNRKLRKEIEERKKIEAALQESEIKYRTLIENANEGIYVVQSEKIRFVNPKGMHLLGYTEEETLSKSISDLVHPDDRELVVSRHIRRIKGDTLPENYPVKIIHKQGHILWGDLKVVVIQWEGEPATLCFLTDVTKKLLAEKALQQAHADLEKKVSERTADLVSAREKIAESERMARAILNGSPAAGALFDRQGTILDANKAFLSLCDMSKKDILDILGRRLWEVLPLRYQADKKAFFEEAIATGESRRFETRFNRRVYDANIEPVAGADHTVTRLVGFAHDITDLCNLQQQLIHSERLAVVGQLAASVAHEINSPLMGLTFAMEALRQKFAADAELVEQIRMIRGAIDTIRQTVNNLMNLSRPAKAPKQRTDLNAIIAETLQLTGGLLKRHGIDARTDLSSEIPEMFLSPQQFSQVFINLINNAVEAIAGAGIRSGRIRIATLRHGDEVVIEFSDNGPGIPEREIRDVFSPFYTKRKDKGMGVGLAICSNIVTDHGGTISAAAGPKAGTIFTIRLPAA